MRDHRDRTMDEAMSRVNREWRQMSRLALAIRTRNDHPAWINEKIKLFTGIYKRLLDDPIDEVRKSADYRR